MVNAPGMPANPGPADIANYDAWAIENNRPLWHERFAAAVAAPAPAAAPVVAPHPAVIRDAVANGTRAYGQSPIQEIFFSR